MPVQPKTLVLILLSGLALGQAAAAATGPDFTAPTDVPARFAPGLVSTAHHEHSRIVFGPGGMDLYWAVIPFDSGFRAERQNIWCMHGTADGWSVPEILPITRDSGASSPALSPDGRTLYIKVPDPDADPEQRPRATRRLASAWTDGRWQAPTPVTDLPLRGDGLVTGSFCFSDNGNLYFDSGGPDETGAWRWSIYVSILENGRYRDPVPLPGDINDGTVDWCPWIAPDESHLLWSSHRDGEVGGGDLYASFRRPDGAWGPAINLGDRVNTPAQERFPSVSPDGRALFFARHTDDTTHSDIYWIDAGFIRELAPQDAGNLETEAR